MLEFSSNETIESKEIQELLEMTFKAERKYFEAAERVQIAEFSRFLHYQSTKRNFFCNKLIEALADNEIEPNKTYIKKGQKSISGLEVKRILEDTDYLRQFEDCLQFDSSLLRKCDEVLNLANLPVNIMEVITKEMTFVTLAKLEAQKVLEKYKSQQEKQQEKAKVIPLSKFTS